MRKSRKIKHYFIKKTGEGRESGRNVETSWKSQDGKKGCLLLNSPSIPYLSTYI